MLPKLYSLCLPQMVLDAGRLVSLYFAEAPRVIYPPSQVEFDSPRELLKKEGGLFKALVDESGDKEMLYGMAERGSEGGR